MAKKTTKRARKTTAKPATETKTTPKVYTGHILVLKTTKAGGEPHCNGEGDGHGGTIRTAFRWPRDGAIVAPDWDPKPQCGGGFHALEFGEGSWNLLREDETPAEEWRVVRVQPDDLVRFTDGGNVKVKFRRGEVIYCGGKAGALTMVMCGKEAMERAMALADPASSGYGSTSASSGDGSKSASSGDYSTSASSGDGSKSASSGDGSTSASSGDGSTSASSGNGSKSASSGDYSKSASSGNGSTSASSGDYSKSASSGYGSTSASSGDGSKSASSGDGSKSASSGDYSKSASSGYGSKSASSGDGSKSASSGDGSKSASSGDYSKSASSGDGSKSASSGDGSKSEQIGKSGISSAIGSNVRGKAGENGLLILTWWDESAKRYRACVGEVGIDGIEADAWYEVKAGKLSRVPA